MSEKEFYTYEIYCGVKAYKHRKGEDLELGKLVDGRETKTAILFEEHIKHQPDYLIEALKENIDIFAKHYKLAQSR